jgi:2-oxoglutarate dehydrogenase E1 component
MRRPYRKPLIIMTPKSTLRRKISFSTLEELSGGAFQPVIGEIDPLKPADVKRVVLCTGKIYYDILEARRERKINDIAIIRVEQLYPFPSDLLTRELRAFTGAREILWAQEEPQNQGAWYSIQDAVRSCMAAGQTLNYVGRAPTAAPAGGDYHKHLERQKNVVEGALTVQSMAKPTVATLQPHLTAGQTHAG